MNVQNDRSYAKESTKTKPSGVRFDKEQLEFIQKKEPKLTTKQKVVDFLLNKFWWEFKVAKPSHKGLPPENLNDMPNYQNPVSELSSLPNYSVHDIQPQVEVKSPITGLAPKLSDFDKFSEQLRQAKSKRDVERIMKDSVGGIMFPRERLALKAVADEVSDDMFND